MDAVKFLREFKRMCSHYNCKDCPVKERPLCIGGFEDLSQEEQERIVRVVEDWSRENPEEIGKKYIIEIDRVKRDCGHKLYHIKDGLWVNEGTIAKFEEYKESEGEE